MTRKAWAVAAAVVVAAATATGAVVALSDGTQATQAAQEQPVNTAAVERGRLSDMISQYGTLTYRARPDGSPFAVINQMRGTYTKLPDAGDKVDCGDVLYRVNDRPVLLLCGRTPAYRSLSEGASGRDVAELNANLVQLGYATRARLAPANQFSSETASALEKLQSKLGQEQTGSLKLGEAVFLPEPVRIATVTGELGGSAQPGAQVAQATSSTLEVQVALDPSQQSEVKTGDHAQITLPGNASVTGKVERLGRVAQVPAGQDSNNPGSASIPAYISLDQPAKARGLDRAPVQVNITTKGVENALNVPVTAIVGKTGGGYAVEFVRADGRRELVAVKLGLFDTAGGRVQIAGELRVGDRVVVPSS